MYVQKCRQLNVQINLYSPLFEGRPVVIVVGGSTNTFPESAKKTEILDYTQTNTWVEGMYY